MRNSFLRCVTFVAMGLVSAAGAAGTAPNDATFGFALLQQVAPEQAQGNVIVAPRNIRTALAAVATGATGATQAQIVSLTGDYATIDNRPSDTTKSALMIWVAPHGTLNPQFVAGLHDADVISTPPDEGAAAINAYIDQHTGGMIGHVIDDVDDAPMVLATALYFYGHWQTPFDTGLTHDGEFHTATGTTETVPLMQREGRFDYAESVAGQIVQLRYGSSDGLCLTVFLPHTGLSIDQWLARTDGAGWLALVASAHADRYGMLELPKLKTGFQDSLKSALQHMGIKVPFTSAADFSGILEHTRLSIGNVVHVTQVDMDERGTKAAAATVMMMGVTAVPMPPGAPFRMLVDRPYFFTIGDGNNHHILFAGIVRKP